jgi:uncharacterized delta-60 repeat protein
VIHTAIAYRSRFAARLGLGLAALLLLLVAAGCGGGTVDPTPTPSGAFDTPAARATATRSANGPSSGSGALDTSFGDQGRVITDLNGRSDEVRGVVVQPDGKIVALGESWVYPQDRPRFALVRYNADGSLDATFGQGGQVLTGLTDDEGDYSKPHALALQPDGKLLAAGTSYSADAGRNVFALARFNADGTFDATFGTGGRVLTPVDTAGDAGNDQATALALAADGSIVLAGGTGTYPANFAAARYRPDGTLDPTFGSGGTVVTDLGGDDKAAAVAIQPDGKIVLAGHYDYDDFAVVRANADGSLDTAFGTEGLVRTPFGRAMDVAYAVALQPDGQIIAGGTGTINDADPLNDNLILVRYTAK